MRSPCQQGIMYLERHIFPIRMGLLIHFIKTGKEEHSHTPPLSKLNVTTQYLHSYNQESIPDRLRRWDFCLQACVLLRSAQQMRRPTEQLLNIFNFCSFSPEQRTKLRRKLSARLFFPLYFSTNCCKLTLYHSAVRKK